MNNIEVDARQVVSMFADLTSGSKGQVYSKCFEKGVLVFWQQKLKDN